MTEAEITVNENQHVYEDEICYAELGKGVVGHVKIFPKKKIKKLEELTGEEVAHLFTVASYTATVVFESLGAQGTNILCNNRKSHDLLCLEVVPRNFSDDLDFQWTPKKVEEAEMQTISARIKDKTFFIGKAKQKEEIAEVKKENKKVYSETYVKQMKRIP